MPKKRPLYRASYIPCNEDPEGFSASKVISDPENPEDEIPFRGTLIRDALDRVVLEWCKERGNRYPKKIVSIGGLRTMLRKGKHAIVHPSCELLKSASFTESNRLFAYEGVQEEMIHMFDETATPFHVKIYAWTSKGFTYRVESEDSRAVFLLP